MNCAACKGELEAEAMFCGYCGRRTRKRRDSAIGALIDDMYRIEEKIAAGGFGAIYRATHLPSGVTLALKLLHADFANDPALTARFLRESKALSKLRSSHTVITYERGETHDGTLYIAMELLEGESLEQRLRARGPLRWREALAIVRAVCSSLAEAHAAGIVHRDLKPANIHLGPDDFVKVLDFGVAKLLPWSNLDDGIELTLAGQAVGTLEYMAPEQLGGDGCDARTDIFALGVVAYEMITGQRPFPEAKNPAALITALLTQPIPIPSRIRSVPGVVDQLLLRCLEREPSQRYANAAELARVIDRILSSPTPTLRPGSTRSCAGTTVEQHVAELRTTTLAYSLPLADTPPAMPTFELPVRGSVIRVNPYAAPAPPEPSPVGMPATRRLWIALAGLLLGVASAAIAGTLL